MDFDEDSVPSESDLEYFALSMVKADPFVTVGEIKREFKRRHPEQKGGRLRVFGILRRHGLLSRKSRFRYAWGRS